MTLRTLCFLAPFALLGCNSGSAGLPDPALPGPYPVGVLTTEAKGLVGKQERRLPVEVWYPAAESARGLPLDTYDWNSLAPADLQATISSLDLPTVTQEAHRDAEPATRERRYPLVIFSHGFGGLRVQSLFWTVHLASHGYVVAAPDHVGNTTFDLVRCTSDTCAVFETIPGRPDDIRILLDDLLRRNEQPEDPIYALFDTARIGISGHSLGGTTTVVAGARYPEFDALVPMAPSVNGVTLALMSTPVSSIQKPIFIMAGTLDHAIAYEEEIKPFYTQLPPPKYLLALVAAGHLTFSDICTLGFDAAIVDSLDSPAFKDFASSFLEDGCAPNNLPFEQAKPAMLGYGTAFLNVYVKGETDYARYLDPQSVTPPGFAEYTASRETP